MCAVLLMTAGYNELRGSGADQKRALKMLWPMWVVLIAGSTGAVLFALPTVALILAAGRAEERSGLKVLSPA